MMSIIKLKQKFLNKRLHTRFYTVNVLSSNAERFVETELPKRVDLRERGIIGPPRNQHRTRSCWLQSPLICIEATYTGTLKRLSAQHVLDCLPEPTVCGANSSYKAYEFVIRNRGIASEDDYPFTGVYPGKCRENEIKTKYGQIDGYRPLLNGDIYGLKKAVNIHPVTVMIEACKEFRENPVGEIYSRPSLLKNLNHSVTVIGYDETCPGDEYFIVLNSYGEKWGDGGYIKMRMYLDLQEGYGGVANNMSYPILLDVNPPPPDKSLRPRVNYPSCTCSLCAPHLYRHSGIELPVVPAEPKIVTLSNGLPLIEYENGISGLNFDADYLKILASLNKDEEPVLEKDHLRNTNSFNGIGATERELPPPNAGFAPLVFSTATSTVGKLQGEIPVADTLTSESVPESSKTTLTGDEKDEKSKCQDIQGKGRFKVTSKNADVDKNGNLSSQSK